jgi:hypothetical protein
LLIHGTLLALATNTGTTGDGRQAMKIYLLFMLISVFVGFSYLPIRSEAKQDVPAPPDSLPA